MAASARINELRHRYAAQPRRYVAALANALRQSGALEEAVTMLRAQLAVHPDHLTGHVVLGQALFDTGALAEAQAAFEAARALDPGNRVVLRHLGEIASLAGDQAAARRWFGRLRAAEPYADDVAAQLGGGVSAPPEDAEHGDASDGDAFVADAFELLEFDPVAADTAALPDAPVPPAPLDPVDPVVGLDLAPPELPAELEAVAPAEDADGGTDGGGQPGDDVAPEHAAPDDAVRDDATALEHITAGPFATETMAGLLAAQGHTTQAIALYERLTAERPGDAALRARFDALRAAPAVGAPDAIGPVVVVATDADRGALLAAAFADLPAAPAAAPAPAADTDPDPFADVSFDRFFVDAGAADPGVADADAAEGPRATRGGNGDESLVDADLARFDEWLRGVAV